MIDVLRFYLNGFLKMRHRLFKTCGRQAAVQYFCKGLGNTAQGVDFAMPAGVDMVRGIIFGIKFNGLFRLIFNDLRKLYLSLFPLLQCNAAE